MEDTKEKSEKIKTFLSFKLIEENMTVLDLSKNNLNCIDENVLLPVNLCELLIAHNNLTNIPMTILNLENIKILDISHNNIQYFDEIPKFYNVLTKLNICNNKLLRPPHWIWTKNCKDLIELNISCNLQITNALSDDYFKELLQYKTVVTEIIIHNCKLKKYIDLFSTFPKAKVLKAGIPELSNTYYSNVLEELPGVGLQQVYDIEILELSNTHIYKVNADIIMFKNLKEINLTLNNVSSLPEEFCCLENLEICILSCNNLLYLPDNFHRLQKLKSLSIDSNQLCMLQENLCNLKNLTKLDLYDNCLYEVPFDVKNLEEIDLAQNYFDEPQYEEYCQQRQKIRLNSPERYDGRKIEKTKSESEYSDKESDDEELLESLNNNQVNTIEINERCPSSPEDWDSDEYWEPYFIERNPIRLSWLHLIKQKLAGNFCPMDAHPVSISDLVKYEKLRNPRAEYESDGQFDDYSDDDSW